MTGAIAALIWSLVMIYFYASGRIQIYVSPAFQTQALVGGIVLGIISLFNLLNISEKASCGHDHNEDEHDHDDACDHNHNHKEGETCGHDHDQEKDGVHSHHHEQETASGMAINFSILLVPVLAAAILTPDAHSDAWIKNMSQAKPGEYRADMALTSRKAQNEDSMAPSERVVPAGETPPVDSGDSKPAADPYAFTEADLDNLVDKNDRGEYVITIPELFYTGGDEALQKVLDGKAVESIGQAMEEINNNADGKRMRIFRLYMECCAADARPLSVPVEFVGPVPAFKEMRWYKVHGTMSFEQNNGFTVPVLKATELIETEPEGDSPFYNKNGQ